MSLRLRTEVSSDSRANASPVPRVSPATSPRATLSTGVGEAGDDGLVAGSVTLSRTGELRAPTGRSMSVMTSAKRWATALLIRAARDGCVSRTVILRSTVSSGTSVVILRASWEGVRSR